MIKHSAAIHIDNTLTLLQRRVWNVLLFHAYDYLLYREVHHLSLATLARLLDYNSHDDAHLKAALTALVRCLVSWNLLDKDEEEWGVATLLASAVIIRGVCYYSYSPPLRQRLYSPRMYARLDLALQNRFASKYAQALWELCTDYLGTSRVHGTTPHIPLELFRKLMGVRSSPSTAPFKTLNRDVLKPALAEMNRVSDLRVTAVLLRQARQVVALQFTIHRITRERACHPSDRLSEQRVLPPVVTLLHDAGLAHRDAWKVWQRGFDGVEESVRPTTYDRDPDEAFLHYVQEKVHLLKQREQSGTLKNPPGFLLTAIHKNYANAQREQEGKRQQHHHQEKDRRQLECAREQLQCAQDDAWQHLSNHMIETQPTLLMEAIAALQAQKDAVLTLCYEPTKSALENYQTHPLMARAVRAWLATRFPERFAEVSAPFQDDLTAIEERMHGQGHEGECTTS